MYALPDKLYFMRDKSDPEILATHRDEQNGQMYVLSFETLDDAVEQEIEARKAGFDFEVVKLSLGIVWFDYMKMKPAPADAPPVPVFLGRGRGRY